MFKRVILEDWQQALPYLCFALIAGAFILIVIQVLRMKKSDVEKLASMPLNDPENTTDPTTTDYEEKE